MAERVYTTEVGMECPRCGSGLAKVAVYHLGTTHQPMCEGCGLTSYKGTDKELVVQVMRNCYHNYSANNPKEVKP